MFASIAWWFASRFSGVTAKLLEFIVAVLLLIVLVGGPYWLGLRHQRAVDHIALQKAQLANQQKLAKADAAGQRIAAKLNVDQVKTQIVYRTITKEVPHVVYKYRKVPGAPLQAVPRAVFTRGLVGLWNCALNPDVSAAACESPETAAGGDPAVDSGLGEHDILANHVVNAQACDDIRKQLTALVDWHRQTEPARQ